MCNKIRIAGTVNDSITDGPGLRFVVFVQGCKKRCIGCHNPSSHDFNSGYDISIDDIIKMVEANPLLSGITISGGEPFEQAENLVLLAKSIKAMNLEVAIYTGYTFEELISSNDENILNLLKYTDILVDGPFEKEKRDYSAKFKGSSNQRIIDVKESLKQNTVVLNETERWS